MATLATDRRCGVSAVAVAEVLGQPLRRLARFPLPCALACRAVHSGRGFTLATSGSSPQGCQAPYFVGPELGALALAVEHGRARWVQLEAWVERRGRDRLWRLTEREAIGALVGRCEPLEWPTGRVLLHLGAQLIEVFV